jgi:hypothetical protein
MKKNNFVSGMAAMALVFGFLVAGCESSPAVSTPKAATPVQEATAAENSPAVPAQTEAGFTTEPSGGGVAREEQESSGINFNFVIVEDESGKSVAIHGYKGQRRDVYIPNYINDVPVTVIKTMAFSFNPFTSVRLPTTLLKIESNAFFGNSLSSIVIPNSVREIGSGAFEKALGEIRDITIGSDVTVSEDAFGTLNSFAETYNKLGKKAGRYIGAARGKISALVENVVYSLAK